MKFQLVVEVLKKSNLNQTKRSVTTQIPVFVCGLWVKCRFSSAIAELLLLGIMLQKLRRADVPVAPRYGLVQMLINEEAAGTDSVVDQQ